MDGIWDWQWCANEWLLLLHPALQRPTRRCSRHSHKPQTPPAPGHPRPRTHTAHTRARAHTHCTQTVPPLVRWHRAVPGAQSSYLIATGSQQTASRTCKTTAAPYCPHTTRLACPHGRPAGVNATPRNRPRARQVLGESLQPDIGRCALQGGVGRGAGPSYSGPTSFSDPQKVSCPFNKTHILWENTVCAFRF